MRIGDAAKALGVSGDTIRRLDRRGVVKIQRDWLGHRRLSDQDVDQLRAILYPQRADDTGDGRETGRRIRAVAEKR